MKPSTSAAGTGPAPGRLRGILALLLQTLLVVAVALPAGIAIAPALLGPGGPSDASQTTPPWQQVPATLSAPGPDSGGIGPLRDTAPVPAGAALAAKLNETLKTDGGGTFTGIVQDAATGQVLFDRAADEARVPASNMKLLTAGAALRVLGPDGRFSTRVVAGPTPGSVVLTGGGDVLLAAGESDPGAVLGRAGLATLAQATVRALQNDGGATGTLSVLLDDSLFSGPALSQAWSPEDVAAGEMAPLYPLALNSARFDPAKTTGPRPQDAAMTAAEAFAAKLTEAAAPAGLSVAPGVARVRPGASPEGARPKVLAEVQSATVGEQVDLMLQTSDNYLAEVMGRMTALGAGRPGSGDDAVAAVLQQVQDMGVPTEGLRAADVSGLALANRVSARQLTDAVRAMTSGADTRLRAALAGFPVAGLTGTLGDRYTEAASAAGAGLVRAKTGTLNTVIALSGYVVDADGRLLVFSFVGNGLTPGAANKAALDRSAAVLAGCGCH
ncbi:D-alanyl-D-alanine carboxypeptidase/D-alanyl-D-alanine-endopeptidase [Arthrobacter sp. NicSoilB8]|uniref:D-alanyl-D-alanine carboxypeptidase/D-alanyl-D-alanine endopeptidase n=1 Tax=Arthrobacter sp. NicSoilB8 TaxID=2830998 RepID=UPI001CC75AB1|nr:D-alanyl-D-alanine carboxypeptidase/D-alanyl-D-alanine-endopeptidase [Arthrobacter sp. NicSoilB8]BCW69212.1 D-alanyl-D-alanine carboxypeptidase/D-alanyl-D-alanine-endopeptidase [Arthrobacter sp. NicSoilB8]